MYSCLKFYGGTGISFYKLFFKCLSIKIELLSRSNNTNWTPSLFIFVSTAYETSLDIYFVVIDAKIGNGDWKIILSIFV
jgi:hypothetical protein